MRLRFLGTGTSFGIPVIGCRCGACTSDDARDRRTRHGALLESDEGRRLLIDAPPELRLQLLEAGIDRIDAVWITHCHADHVHGLDDLRAFTLRRESDLVAYTAAECAETLRQRFGYIFDRGYRPEAGTSRPELRLRAVDPRREVDVAGVRLRPLPVAHGRTTAYGFRCGALGYITDAKRLPPPTRQALEGVRVLVVNALWFGNPHPTHFNIEEAIDTAQELGAERTYLTHLTHRVRHAELLQRLPDGVEPAYDGLVIEI